MQASLLYSSLIVITPQRGDSSTWKGTTLNFISNYKEVPNNFMQSFDFWNICISNIHTIITCSSLNLVCFAWSQWIENFLFSVSLTSIKIHFFSSILGNCHFPLDPFFLYKDIFGIKWFIIHISCIDFVKKRYILFFPEDRYTQKLSFKTKCLLMILILK